MAIREALLKIPVYSFLHAKYADKTLPNATELTNVLIHERSYEKEQARDWAEKFCEGVRVANLLTQAGNKTVLLEKPLKDASSTTFSEESPTSQEQQRPRPHTSPAPISLPPPISAREDIVVLRIPFQGDRFAEVRFSPDLSTEDFSVLLSMLEAYQKRGAKPSQKAL